MTANGSIARHFADPPDQQVDQAKQHSLADILAITHGISNPTSIGLPRIFHHF